MTGTKPAAGRGASATWRQAYDDLTARGVGELDVVGLERLGEAAFWTGRPREAIDARRRAHAIHRAAGRDARAAKVAWLLFSGHFDLDEMAAASGWLGCARRDAETARGSPECGYVALASGEWALYRGDTGSALAHVDEARRTGQVHRDRDLVALSLATEGRVRVTRGETAEGIALLDEAMAEATCGGLTPFVTGWVYCLLLYTCQLLGDVGRAGEWSDWAMRWCAEHGEESWYPGLCRLHRCEVAVQRGEWTSAEREAVRAVEELAAFGDFAIADGHYLAGEIRRRRGDHSAAERAFRRVHELGGNPQPGLALLRIDQGDAEAAVTALAVALAGAPARPLPRARLLDAHVRASLCAGDVATARGSADELAALATGMDAILMRALTTASRGAVMLAEDDVGHAVPALREAVAAYRRLACPYEAAQARELLGRALRRAGDEDGAAMEFDAAVVAYRHLGAVPDARRASALAGEHASYPKGLTAREVEVLRLVARGESNRAVAAELFISEHTVARHLSNIFSKVGVPSRSAATAFAFGHGLVADDAAGRRTSSGSGRAPRPAS
ncbi:regulatory LuxR family protein [Haloactinopolyspora alba]|uniref:Regulatory LuxR family protein n=1 Tax=Haloactinopolyspora alba TaxID=648780 RepID=A0A2P8DEB1_9ACTN|nr:LuxR C-terminal-related transcriptional regulator [Haloactinopolyspora alba]PSK95535.1 regulatory LuxR family protein [Haloactinopolyspora alba]